jgi:ABC-type transport system involved in multi-copper enzyme maturation permease subunit
MSPSPVFPIAASVFRESVRDRVPYNLVIFAILLMGASYLLGQLTAGQELKIIKDLGLAAMSMFGLFIALFIGIGLVSKEVERRSIYGLLSKPISRAQFLLGKYVGLVVTLVVNVGVMSVALYAVLGYMAVTESEDFKRGWEAPALDPMLIVAIGLILLGLMLVTAIALLFSTFSSPMVSAATTLGLYVAGHFSDDLRHLDQSVDSRVAGVLGRLLSYLLPDLSVFDVKARVVHGLPVPFDEVAWAVGYGLVYIVGLLAVSILIFNRRDFK